MEGRFKNYKTITYPHHHCHFSQSGDSIDILDVATRIVKETICTAENFIGEDLPEYFYYKLSNKKVQFTKSHPVYPSSNSSTPRSTSSTQDEKEYFDYNDNLIAYTSLSTVTAGSKYEARHPDDIEWPTIERFNLRDCASQIRDYIELWNLMPSTKCALVVKDEVKTSPDKGRTYYVDALFSNPTPKCPNPLAVAKVHFSIHVPELMPKHYHVMVTYRFEGYRSIYYAIGHKQIRSLDFQRFFIDTILHTKLTFYSELFRCRFPHEKDSSDTGKESESDISLFECENSSNFNEQDEECNTTEDYVSVN